MPDRPDTRDDLRDLGRPHTDDERRAAVAADAAYAEWWRQQHA